jgi:molybdate transport system substrate-binding protein
MSLALRLLFSVVGLVPAHAPAPPPEPPASRQLLVFAAASLNESMTELGAAFEKRSGTKVAFSFGASSDLERQIEAGAPADVFFSADTAKMDALEKAGLVEKADRREFLSNVLVVVVPADSTAKIESAKDLAAQPKIALADPAAVPAGIYAKKWLTAAGVWDQVAPKVVPTLDVRAALAAVAGGDVPAGVVYATDAAVGKGTTVAMTVTDGPPITYSLAALPGSKNPASAKRFVAFLAGSDGRAVFQKRGFRILPGP